VYSISAYNDNGFNGLVKNDNVVYRTDFFIGLGWLLSRRLWELELQQKWPATHWDHFLREDRNRLGRHTLFPEVARTYHIGYRGTHSNIAMYEKYFRNIMLNSHGFAPLGVKADFTTTSSGQLQLTSFKPTLSKIVDADLRVRTLEYLNEKHYDAMLDFFFNGNLNGDKTVFVNNVDQLNSESGKYLIVAYEAPHALTNTQWFKISQYFNVWHTHPVRGDYKGVSIIRWSQNNLVLMVASFSVYFQRYHQQIQAAKVFVGDDFLLQLDKRWIAPRVRQSTVKVIVSKQGQSCMGACIERYGDKSRCDLFYTNGELNNCKALQTHFKCSTCAGNVGYDQPALDVEQNTCLFNTAGMAQYQTTCEGSHPKTQRLCACVEGEVGETYASEWAEMMQQHYKEATVPTLD